MHRFFVPPEWLGTETITLTGSLAHQIIHVLRLRPGEHVILLDNDGWEYDVELQAVQQREVTGAIVHKRLGAREPSTKVTLYQSILKGDHFGYVLQKGTEVGVSAFVPVLSERCIVGDVNAAAAKVSRWQRIILEAAEQSGRSTCPVLKPALLFSQACQAAAGKGWSIIPWEGEKATRLADLLADHPYPMAINIFIGPEGGFSNDEIHLASGYGITPVSLGPRILRAETAGVVTTALILYHYGDLG